MKHTPTLLGTQLLAPLEVLRRTYEPGIRQGMRSVQSAM